MEIAFIALVASIGLAMVVYPRFIDYLESKDTKQTVSEYALEAFKNKKKTVTFGGVVFVLVTILVALVVNGLRVNRDLMLLVLVFASYAMIGFIDDYKIVKEGKNDGIAPRTKMVLQLFFAVLFYVLYVTTGGETSLAIPFMNKPIHIGWLYLPLVMFMFSGASNAVNLTDGMDGLAAGTTVIALLPFAFLAYRLNRVGILIFIMALIGALIAFLFFNRKPAKIFMGDVGSLALGAVLAALAVLMKIELIFVVIAGVFVFETITVIIQRASWKLRKKRVFRYTPIHYSFTLNGWEETDVVNFFYAIGLVCMVVGFVLITLS